MTGATSWAMSGHSSLDSTNNIYANVTTAISMKVLGNVIPKRTTIHTLLAEKANLWTLEASSPNEILAISKETSTLEYNDSLHGTDNNNALYSIHNMFGRRTDRTYRIWRCHSDTEL